ncbi:DUF4396 domain-containing protein [Nitratireductor sp. XY-223]|uniref:DUF4396 domain-containing protein n=1 Tax=Nitratireductor sp. XY-223 TaxID=2561926 RepID=UPI0010AA3D50|nr:DUF4396 domain-containing protein [Nitratireductor sp. XY-223]
MLDGAMTVWFVLTACSIAFVVYDSLYNGVTSWVQRAAWILVTAYTGPVGLFFYLLACRRPFTGGHDRYTAAGWKQAVNSEMHCLAGDATGILAAALVVSSLGLANGWDITVEYLAGFVCGLFIFQALMMMGMYQGNYLLAVRKTFFAETVSMNFVMAGMIPTMVVLAHLWEGSESPVNAAFWFRMSLASLVGGIVAYPINYWLVSRHLKHGCMTLPGADGPAGGLGHRSPEPATHGHMEGMHGQVHQGHEMSDHGAMEMGSLSGAASTSWVVFSFAVLFAALVGTGYFVPIRF